MTHRTPRSSLRAPRTVARIATLSIATSLGITWATGIIGSQYAVAQTARGAAPPSVGAREPVTLNFANAEIEAVARTMSTITGRNVVVDPRVKGTMTLVTERPVPPAVAFDQFLAALRLQNFTVVEAAGLYKVVPEADAKLQSGAVTVSPGGRGSVSGNQIVTQIFKLNFENANNLVPVLRPLISPNNTINVNPGNNSLVITDYAENLQRMAKIIAAMDVSNASDVEVIPLHYQNATELAPLISRLVEGTGTQAAISGGVPPASGMPPSQGQTDNAFRTTLIAEPRSNALILRAANPARVALVRSLVAKLDQPAQDSANGDAGNIYVVYLKNAEATRLAVTLRAALASLAAASGSTGAGGGTGMPGGSGGMTLPTSMSQAPSGSFGGSGSGSASSLGSSVSSNFGNSAMPSTGGSIQADPATNSLIITASEPQYRQLRAVIEKLDGRRAQVLVESLVVEVNASKLAEFGIQWQTALGSNGSGTIGVIGNNSGITGTNIIDLAVGLAAKNVNTRPSTGFNVGLAPRFNGKYYLGALANFLQNSGDANVLSTPNLLTLDNEEAKIIIGQNVPFPTGSYANTTGSATVNPFTTVERKDVGLTLRVKPQINENGTVKMAIYQEVSSVNADSTKDANGPTTSKRAIESNVLVDDGSIVVLGGLLSDDYSLGQDKVPVLGDVPLLGGLFRNETRSRKKTNLMVFLRPTVIRDSATSDSLAQDRYDAIRALQMNTQPADSTVLQGVNAAPVLPPLPGIEPKAAPREGGIRGTVLIPPPMPPAVTAPPDTPLRGALPPTADPATRRESP